MTSLGRTHTISEQLLCLAEPVRLRIARVLEREELSVGEVAKVVQLPQSTVSRHLKTLGEAGWLVKRPEGTATLYRLVLDDLPPENRAIWVTVREQLAAQGAKGDDPELAEDLRRLAAVLEERREDSQAFFGRIGGQWDNVRAELFGQRFTSQALLALIPGDWVVADLGCGTGNATELLAPHVKRVLAIDQSETMLEAAHKRLGGVGGVTNVDFVKADLTALPLKDASVDAAVCVLVLHHAEEPVKLLAEARRVLKPNGVMLIVDMLEHDRRTYKHTMGHRWQGFSKPLMSKWLGGAGYRAESVRFVPLPADPAGKGPGLFVCTACAGDEAGR